MELVVTVVSAALWCGYGYLMWCRGFDAGKEACRRALREVLAERRK